MKVLRWIRTVHLSICMCEHLFQQCSGVTYKGEIWHFQGLQAAAFGLFPWTAVLWNNHSIGIFLLLLRSHRSPTIAFPLALSFLRFPSLPPSSAELGPARSPPSLPQSTASLLTSRCPFRLTSERPPPPSSSSPLVIHLHPAVFHAEDSCLNVCVKSYFLFSLSPDRFPKMNSAVCVKTQRMVGQIKKSDMVIVFWFPSQETSYQREIKDSISLQRKCRILWGEMFWGKYA